jgi:hypothetical protein
MCSTLCTSIIFSLFLPTDGFSLLFLDISDAISCYEDRFLNSDLEGENHFTSPLERISFVSVLVN